MVNTIILSGNKLFWVEFKSKKDVLLFKFECKTVQNFSIQSSKKCMYPHVINYVWPEKPCLMLVWQSFTIPDV